MTEMPRAPNSFRCRAGEMLDRRLGPGIGRIERRVGAEQRRHQRADLAVVVDVAAGLLEEEERGLGVDRAHRVIFGLRDLDHRFLQHLADGVDRDVGAADRGDRVGEQLLHRACCCEIGLEGDRLAACGLQRRHRRVGIGLGGRAVVVDRDRSDSGLIAAARRSDADECRRPRISRTPRTPDDLGAHWAVNYASPSTGRIEEWEWSEQGATRTIAMRGRVTVNSAEAYIACCLAGLGLIQIPAYDVKRHLDAGELVELMPRHRAAPMPMTLLYPHRQHLSRRLQVFADWLTDLLKQKLLAAG
ncbi:hypothetical protein ACVIIY_007357 [Bradyrhizobium sp. USDA 4515]|nr:hypothetical protein [Bradyrhizobium elkanii]